MPTDSTEAMLEDMVNELYYKWVYIIILPLAATAYGSGTYFARDASYSASPTYSKPDQNGYKYMYFVRVLAGEYTVGKSSMVVPPPKDPTKDQHVLFDSLVNNTSSPTIFVVVPDAQSYPEYLITFK